MPNSEDELGVGECPDEGGLLPVWNGGEGEEEEEEGGEMELEGEEENSGGYHYQPLNQEPEQPGDDRGEEGPSHTEQLQQVQHRIEVSSAWRRLGFTALCLHHHGQSILSSAGDGAPPS